MRAQYLLLLIILVIIIACNNTNSNYKSTSIKKEEFQEKIKKIPIDSLFAIEDSPIDSMITLGNLYNLDLFFGFRKLKFNTVYSEL